MKLKKFDTKKIKVGTTKPLPGHTYKIRGPGSKSVDTTPTRTPAPADPKYYKKKKKQQRPISTYEDYWFTGFKTFEEGK